MVVIRIPYIPSGLTYSKHNMEIVILWNVTHCHPGYLEFLKYTINKILLNYTKMRIKKTR